jgi:predicted transcriptional regulator
MVTGASSERSIIFSIKPKYAEKIISGEKKIELRRVKPNHIYKNTYVLIYVSSPVQSIIGSFIVDSVIHETIPELWERSFEISSVSKKEYNKYFAGVTKGVGIFIKNVQQFKKPITLKTLKVKLPDFNMPQSFRYISPTELTSIL